MSEQRDLISHVPFIRKDHHDWTMNRGMLSPRYTTNCRELRVVS
ncbi:DUF4113 domain-containing protein [Rhodanobacter sp. TND4EL1]